MEFDTKVVFILSDQDDYSTHKLLDHLIHQKSEYVLLNETLQLKFVHAIVKNNQIDYLIKS